MESVPVLSADKAIQVTKDGLSYLASPIGNNPQKARLLGLAKKATIWFKNHGCPVYSPAAYINYGRPPPQGWYEWDIQFMRAAKRLVILDIPPHTALSKGCRYELEEAGKVGIPAYRLPCGLVEGELH